MTGMVAGELRISSCGDQEDTKLGESTGVPELQVHERSDIEHFAKREKNACLLLRSWLKNGI